MSTAITPERPIPNSYWVIPGRLAAGEYPGHWLPDKAAVKVGSLLDGEIDHFIDLTEAGECTPFGLLLPYSDIADAEARRRNLTTCWERHPIHDRDIPRSKKEMIDVLDAIDAALDNDKTVYVHCWGGVGRTGTVVGCWLVRHGRSGDDALNRVGELFSGMEKAPYRNGSPETTEQKDYVRKWAERSREE